MQVTHTVYLCVAYVYRNKPWWLRHTALSDWWRTVLSLEEKLLLDGCHSSKCYLAVCSGFYWQEHWIYENWFLIMVNNHIEILLVVAVWNVEVGHVRFGQIHWLHLGGRSDFWIPTIVNMEAVYYILSWPISKKHVCQLFWHLISLWQCTQVLFPTTAQN